MTRTEGGRSKAARRIGLLALPLLVAATFAGCGDDDDSDSGLLGGDEGQQEQGTDSGTAAPDTSGDETAPTPSDGGSAGSESGSAVPDVAAADVTTPSGIGGLDTLVSSCGGGDMQACDDIYTEAQNFASEPSIIDYVVYGDSCGGLQPTNTGNWCTDAFG